jgi:23S rRNA G2069 N7-methylase RlmK/C1962 C5-methylase RlmI
MPTVHFMGMRKPRSHVIWFKNYGVWPKGELDHKDGNHNNDAISNLREATRQQNNFNRIDYRNTSGERGVVIDKAGHHWQVKVYARPIKIHANASHKISAIVAARLIRRVLHGEFAYENRPTTHPA